MADIKMSHSLLQKIPNPTLDGFKLTTVNSMTIMGTTLFVLKSKGSKTTEGFPICLYKITNFNTSPTIKYLPVKKADGSIPHIAKHSNAITYAKRDGDTNGFLYIATMNNIDKPQIIKVSTSGILKKEYFYSKNGANAKLSCINCIGKDNNNNLKFIVGIGNSGTAYFYDKATLIGNQLIYDGITFSISIEPGHTANDIYYQDGILYSTFFKRNSKGKIKSNKVLCTNINQAKNGDVLQPYKVLIDNAVTAESLYEIEGIIKYNGLFYVVANRASDKTEYNGDGVFRLKKKNLRG